MKQSEYILVTAGCSYTHNLEYTKQIISNNNLNCRVVNLGKSSSSISFTKETIINLISHLKAQNIKANNIFIVFNCTQIGRLTKKIPNELLNEFSGIVKTTWKNENPKSFMGMNYSSYPYGYNYINNNLYTSFIDKNLNKFPYNSRNWINETIDSIGKIDILEHMQSYLEDIVLIQHFLKSNGIDYCCFFMNNVFEGWYYDTILKHKYSNNKTYLIPNLSDSIKIWELNSLLNELFNMLDLSKFILYNSKGQTYGGLDEFTIDNYSSENFTDFNSESRNTNPFGHHPRGDAVTDFESIYIYPRLERFINKIK